MQDLEKLIKKIDDLKTSLAEENWIAGLTQEEILLVSGKIATARNSLLDAVFIATGILSDFLLIQNDSHPGSEPEWAFRQKWPLIPHLNCHPISL